MKSINKLSGTICHSCRTIIGNSFTENLLCSKCQEKAIELLKENYNTLKTDGYGCRELELFLKPIEDEES